MQNPFSTTFSKQPDNTYISTIQPRDIIENFSYDKPSEAVYKITGVRGSGKTVMLADINQTMRSEEMAEAGWLVYTLNSGRDLLVQFAACLHNEKFIKDGAKSRSINISATVFGTGGGIGYSKESDDRYFDIGIEIEKMLVIVQEKKKKVLICVDEVSKTPDMVVFALEFGKWLISGYPVNFVCTGLYENVMELGNTGNLTFFRRGTTVETTPLNFVKMAEMYKSKLDIDSDTAKEMAGITKGYAYAFQQLGSLYFKKNKNDTMDDVIRKLKSELFAYSYEKIWEELTPEDKFLTRLITEKAEYKREEVLKLMGEKSGNYSVYRDRLLKRGVISARQGYISLALPYFADFVREYGI